MKFSKARSRRAFMLDKKSHIRATASSFVSGDKTIAMKSQDCDQVIQNVDCGDSCFNSCKDRCTSGCSETCIGCSANNNW